MAVKYLLAAIIWFSIFSNALAWRHGNPADNTIKTLMVGAGGQLTRIDIQCDQGLNQCNNSGTTTMVTRPDTYGAYKWITSGTCEIGVPAPCWNQIVTTSTLPVGDPNTVFGACGTGRYCAAYEIQIAPSNTNVAYMLLNGYLYKTVNLRSSQVTWSRLSAWTTSSVYADENTKFFGPFLAIDPQNPDAFVVGTQSGSAFYSIDGGATFSTITLGTSCTPATVPNAHGGGYIFAYDQSSSVSGGLTQGIYLACYGTGVYQSTTGPSGTFTLLNGAGAPTTGTKQIVVSNAGLVYVVANSNVELYSSGTWSEIFNGTTMGVSVASIAIDRNNPTNMLVTGGASTGGQYYSTNSATAPSWPGNKITAYTRSSATVPWLQLSSGELGGTSFAHIIFDPSQSNTIFIADGISVWSVVPNLNGNCGNYCYALTAYAAGIEQLVTNWMVSPPGGNPVGFAWDRPTWTMTSLNTYKSNYGVNHNQAVTDGWSGDYAPSNANYIFAYVNFGNASAQTSGYSSNGGGTTGAPSNWTVFPSQPFPTQFSGSIAALSTTNIAIIQNGSALYGDIFFSTDRGTTFTGLSSCSGVPSPSNGVSQSQTIIDSGTITFTNVGTGKVYPTSGAFLMRRTSDLSQYMQGTVSSYNSGTGQLDLSVTSSSFTVAASFTGSISGTTLTVSSVGSGSIVVGGRLHGTGISANTKIVSQTTGPAGGAGDYVVNNSQTIASESMTSSTLGTFSDWTITQATGWGSNIGFQVNRHTLTADKIDGFYYGFNYSIAPGVYKISWDGLTCTKVITGNFDTSSTDGYGATLISPPGVTGHLFFTAGPQNPDVSTQKFWHCDLSSLPCSDTDQYVNGVTDVYYFGFGANKPGDPFPALYCYCRVGNDPGLWRGTGLSTTPVWTKLSGHNIGGWLDAVHHITGDMNTYGKVYIGFQGSGWKYGYFNFLLKRDLDPASNDNSPMWLEKAA